MLIKVKSDEYKLELENCVNSVQVLIGEACGVVEKSIPKWNEIYELVSRANELMSSSKGGSIFPSGKDLMDVIIVLDEKRIEVDTKIFNKAIELEVILSTIRLINVLDVNTTHKQLIAMERKIRYAENADELLNSYKSFLGYLKTLEFIVEN